MSTVSTMGTAATPVVPPFPIYQISVQKYHEMIQKGVLTEDDPVELLEGWIVLKVPRNPEHDTTIDMADAALRPLLPSGWRVRVQNAITTGDSEPEPDLTVVEGDLRAFLTRHPGPSDIGLVIESAEFSLTTDRVDKGRIYARSNIPIYWVINLAGNKTGNSRKQDTHLLQARSETAGNKNNKNKTTKTRHTPFAGKVGSLSESRDSLWHLPHDDG